MTGREVTQKSDLGRICMSRLYEKGFCGPNYGLSDVNVHVSQYEKGGLIDVYFYDMQTNISPSHSRHGEAEELLYSSD